MLSRDKAVDIKLVMASVFVLVYQQLRQYLYLRRRDKAVDVKLVIIHAPACDPELLSPRLLEC
jgi:hypothetical protein